MTLFKSRSETADLTDLTAIPDQVSQSSGLAEIFDKLSHSGDGERERVRLETDAALARLRGDVRRRLEDDATRARAARQARFPAGLRTVFGTGYTEVTRRFGQMLRKA